MYFKCKSRYFLFLIKEIFKFYFTFIFKSTNIILYIRYILLFNNYPLIINTIVLYYKIFINRFIFMADHMKDFRNINFTPMVPDDQNPLLRIQMLYRAFQTDCMKQTIELGYINGSEDEVLNGIFKVIDMELDKILEGGTLSKETIAFLKKSLEDGRRKGFKLMFQSLQQWVRIAYHKVADDLGGPKKFVLKKEGDRFHDEIGCMFNKLIIKAQELAKKNGEK